MNTQQLNSTSSAEQAVPMPWTPVQWTSSPSTVEVSVWGRIYRFQGEPLPASIKTAGRELLSQPVRLVSRQKGIKEKWSSANVSLFRGQSTHVELSGGLEQPGFWVGSNIRVEFDGMVRFDLVVAPWKNSEPVIEQLWLEIPLRPECAALFTYWPVNAGGAVQCNQAVNSGLLPDKGLALPFKPVIWLGWEEGGLSWFAESDQKWQPADSERAIEVICEQDQVILRLHLLDSAPRSWQGKKDSWGEALEPVTFTFGLQATPVKPWPADFHSWRFAQLDYNKHLSSYQVEMTPVNAGSQETILDRIAVKGVRIAAIHEKWTDIENYWETSRGDEIKATVNACHARNIKVIPYLGYTISTLMPEWAEVADHVVLKDAAGYYQLGYQRQPTQRNYIVCYNSKWQEQWLAGVEWMLKEYDFDGVYLDGTPMPFGCANAAHGCGYTAADGSRHITYPIFAVRRMFQRLYDIVSARGGLITAHQSSCCCTPTLGFCHSYWDGEHLGSEARKKMGTQDGLAIFRAEFMGRNFGIPCDFLGSPEALAYTLLHDVWIRPDHAAYLDAVAPVWSLFEKFNVDTAEWIPYWRNHKWIETTPECVKASLYFRKEQPGQRAALLIVVSNTAADRAVTATIRLGHGGENWLATARAKNAMSESPIEINDRIITLDIKPLNYIFVELNQGVKCHG